MRGLLIFVIALIVAIVAGALVNDFHVVVGFVAFLVVVAIAAFLTKPSHDSPH